MIYWLLFSILSGIAEARIFSQVSWTRKTDSFFDEHFYLNLVRAVALWSMCGGWELMPAALMFPLLHDGAYYEAYKRFLPGQYPKGWRDRSTTTDAIVSLSFENRLFFAASGAAGWAIISL